MVDLSEFEPENKKTCKYAALFLSDDQREKVDAVMDNKTYSTYVIRKVLNSWSKPLASQTIDKHRKRNDDGQRLCGCEN